MLNIVIPSIELWDNKHEIFLYTKEQRLTLEHSLVSLSKWESKWKKPFLSKDKKTSEETISYIKCMTLTQNIKDEVYSYIPNTVIDIVNEYIDDPMTATTFSENNNKKNSNSKTGKFITSELIYAKMVTMNIPVEFQKWHLNRLITLINIIELESKPPTKKSAREMANRNAAINAARRKKYNTKG